MKIKHHFEDVSEPVGIIMPERAVLEAERDPFLPPSELEQQCLAILQQIDAFLPAQPQEMSPSLVGSPQALDRLQAQVVLTSAARWKEFLATQIGERRAKARVLAAGVNWMKRYVAFTHRNKIEKLSQDQFQTLQDYEYRQLLLEAEVTRLESMLDQQNAVYAAASRNLTGSIAH